MKNTLIKRYVWLVMLVIGLFLMTGCQNTSPIVNYKIINNASQQHMVVGFFSVTDLTIEVTYKSGEIETVEVNESMVSEEDLNKLNIPGPQTIFIRYKKTPLPFEFELYPDTLSTALRPFYDYINPDGSNSRYREWITPIRGDIFPVSESIELFYYSQTFYWRYEHEVEWRLFGNISSEPYEVDSDYVYMGSKENPKMMLDIDQFDNDTFNQIYQDYVDNSLHTGSFNAFIERWFTETNVQNPVHKVEYVYQPTQRTFEFVFGGKQITEQPIHHTSSQKHIGWAKSAEHSSLFYGSIEGYTVLVPVYESLLNGFSLEVLDETWDTLTLKIVLTGHLSLHGMDLLLTYDTEQYTVNSIHYSHIGKALSTSGVLSYNYLYVTVPMAENQWSITLYLKKLTPNHDLSKITLDVKEVIYINEFNRPVHSDFVNVGWIN